MNSSSKSLSHSMSNTASTTLSESLSPSSNDSSGTWTSSVSATPPPTDAPSVDVAESVAQGVGVGALLVGASFASFTTAAVTSLMMLQTSMGALAASKRCQVGYIKSATKSGSTANAPPPPIGSTLVSNPLQLAVRSDAIDSDLQYAAGGIIGNIVVVACAAMLIEGGMMLWTNRQRIGDKQVLLEGCSGVWRALPGRGTAVFSSLLLPSVSSCTVVFHHASAMPVSFGVVGLLVYVVSPLALMLLTLRHKYSIETTDVDANATPESNGVGAQHWSLQRFRSFLDGFSLRYRWYCVVDFATAVLCGILAALPEDSSSPACKWAIWATLGVMATATLSAAVLRPREDAIDNVFSIFNRSLSTAIVALCAAGELDAAAIASSVLSCLCLVPPVLMMIKSGRSTNTLSGCSTRMENAFELHSIADSTNHDGDAVTFEMTCEDDVDLVVDDDAASAAPLVPLLHSGEDEDSEEQRAARRKLSFFGIEHYFVDTDGDTTLTTRKECGR